MSSFISQGGKIIQVIIFSILIIFRIRGQVETSSVRRGSDCFVTVVSTELSTTSDMSESLCEEEEDDIDLEESGTGEGTGMDYSHINGFFQLRAIEYLEYTWSYLIFGAI